MAPGAIQRVCAGSAEQLAAFFSEKRLQLQPGLLDRRGGQYCHIYYEPALPGFRASPEDAPVDELFLSLEGATLLSRRKVAPGDSLDVARQVLLHLHRPLQVHIGAAIATDASFHAAVRHLFPNTNHSFQLHRFPTGDYNPWAQDYLKAGSLQGEKRILVTRQGFEGRLAMGSEVLPLLNSYQGSRYVRSKLSWEGGDIQFAMHPNQPGKLIMFYGTTAKRYWGDGLTQAEFEHILRLEFGADLAVYLGDLTPHVDYLLAILPAARIALISEPACGNLELATAALHLLRSRFHGAPPRQLADLSESLANPAERQRSLELVHLAKQVHSGWRTPADPDTMAKLESYLAANCPRDDRECLQNGGLDRLFTTAPGLLSLWADTAARVRMESLLPLRLLDIIEGQLQPCDAARTQRLEQIAGTLRQIGFHVIRMPAIPGSTDRMSFWSGVSYANLALIDDRLFVPRLGLGAFEDRWIHHLRHQLPSYQVVPVDARQLLLFNGGVHCVFAFGRPPLPR